MMQRRILLGAGAVILIVGFLGLRSVTRHQAGQALDQGIDQFVARLPPGYAVRHGVVDYNPLTSAATVHGLVVTHDGATVATADTLTVSGADGQAVQDVFDPAAYPAGKPAWTDRKLLIADASAQKIHLILQGSPPADLVIGRASLHRLSGRPFMLPPTPENRVTTAFMADAALAMAADELQVHDVVWTPIAPPAPNAPAAAISQDAAPAGTDRLSVGDTTVSDYDGGKFGSLAVKTVVLDSDGKTAGKTGANQGGRPFRMTAGRFDLTSADLRHALEAARQADHADTSMLGRLTYASFGLFDVALDLSAGPHLGLQEFRAAQTPAETPASLGEPAPATGEASLHGLTVSTGQMVVPPAAEASFTAFGMRALTMDVNASSQKQPGKASTIDEDVVLRDLGALHIKGSFSGYDAARASATKPLAAVLGATLDHASIVYEDHSLTNRVLAVAAVQTHSTPDIVRAQLAMPVLTLGLMLPGQPDAADQITNFLNHPGTLSITMDPPQKVTLAQIAAAPVPARAQMLGIHITSK